MFELFFKFVGRSAGVDFGVAEAVAVANPALAVAAHGVDCGLYVGAREEFVGGRAVDATDVNLVVDVRDVAAHA